MPQLQKIFTLDVTPEKFLENCSPSELIETELLLSSERFQQRIRGKIAQCPASDYGCPHHAWLSNDCKKLDFLQGGVSLGIGNCENQ
jgi:hypothetical protein